MGEGWLGCLRASLRSGSGVGNVGLGLHKSLSGDYDDALVVCARSVLREL